MTTTILSGNIRNIKLDLIEKLCLVLYCEPYDILWWSPGKENPFPNDHPIMVMKKTKQEYDWKGPLKTMSLNDINMLAMALQQRKNQTKKNNNG